jgi:phosphorylcholine metabolism protein LicD
MKEKTLIESLKQIKNVLDKNNIEFWLDTGTLLGAVREKRILPWDYDIDLGAWYEDISKIENVFDEIEKLNYEVCYFPNEKCIKILKEDCEIDINLYQQEKDNATKTWYVNNKMGKIFDYLRWILRVDQVNLKRSKMPETLTKILMVKRKIIPKKSREKIAKSIDSLYNKKGCNLVSISIPKKYFTDLSEIEFYNTKFKAPSKIEDYLLLRYGKDWRTPKKDYVYYKDDKSITECKK